MNKRERVLAAIRGEPVDRVPYSFWLHNFAREHSAAALTEETVRLYRTFDWDFLKPQSRATCFAEMWGLAYQPSAERAKPCTITRLPVLRGADFGRLEPADASRGALAEQLDALLAIRAQVGPEVPIVATIFAPLMSATFMLPGGREAVLRMMREEPAVLESGLAAIAATLADYARRCVAAGIDGVFYATTIATAAQMSTAEFRRFQRPFDLAILAAAAGAPFNIVHMCGDGILFDEFVDYPATVFSWATTPGNPGLAAVESRTGRAVLGGLPGKPAIAGMAPEALAARARAAIAEMRGRHHLLGPDCSINPDTAEPLMHAVGAAVRGPVSAA